MNVRHHSNVRLGPHMFLLGINLRPKARLDFMRVSIALRYRHRVDSAPALLTLVKFARVRRTKMES